MSNPEYKKKPGLSQVSLIFACVLLLTLSSVLCILTRARDVAAEPLFSLMVSCGHVGRFWNVILSAGDRLCQ